MTLNILEYFMSNSAVEKSFESCNKRKNNNDQGKIPKKNRFGVEESSRLVIDLVDIVLIEHSE